MEKFLMISFLMVTLVGCGGSSEEVAKAPVPPIKCEVSGTRVWDKNKCEPVYSCPVGGTRVLDLKDCKPVEHPTALFEWLAADGSRRSIEEFFKTFQANPIYNAEEYKVAFGTTQHGKILCQKIDNTLTFHVPSVDASSDFKKSELDKTAKRTLLDTLWEDCDINGEELGSEVVDANMPNANKIVEFEAKFARPFDLTLDGLELLAKYYESSNLEMIEDSDSSRGAVSNNDYLVTHTKNNGGIQIKVTNKAFNEILNQVAVRTNPEKMTVYMLQIYKSVFTEQELDLMKLDIDAELKKYKQNKALYIHLIGKLL